MLRLAGDERLVEQIRAGNEAAFEVAFERHGKAVLSFCRHMLGSLEEAEDVVQHTFAAAYSDLLRSPAREISLKPWLFTIARNRCLSLLRAKREQPQEFAEPVAGPLSERIEARAELRQLLADLRELPAEQRAALLLMEVGDLSQVEIGQVLECEASRVKALVFRARRSLIDRREARAIPCDQVQERLANLRGGALRRNELRLHLRECADCRTFRDKVREQRGLLAAALPVAPSLGLKAAVLGAIGIGGGTGGGAAAGLASFASVAGAATAKLAAVGLVAGGAAITGAVVLERESAPPVPPRQEAQAPARPAPAPAAPIVAATVPLPAGTPSVNAERRRAASEPGPRRSGRRRAGEHGPRSGTPAKKAEGRTLPPGQAKKAEADAPGHGGREHPNRAAANPVKVKKAPSVRPNPGRTKKAEGSPVGVQRGGAKAKAKPVPEPGPKPQVPGPAVPSE